MKALITGSEGFVGLHLYKLLKDKEYEVWGFDKKDGFDLLNYEDIRLILDEFRPDEIYHLAAQAYVPESFTSPNRTVDMNIKGTINLLEAVKNLGIKPKILLACSSEEYGFVKPEECPIKETNELRPQSPYGVTKLACDLLGKWYADQYGLHIVRTRAFNHTGPGRGEMYVTSSFAKQIAQIEKNGGKLEHGNLDAVRDFTDVRDMVNAYTLAIQLEPDVYNIGSGQGISIQNMLDILISYTNNIECKLDKSRIRKTEVPRLICDCTKFKSLTKWESKIPLELTLLDLLNYWRERA
jgi:GDP-4-dehydro-6-deoxy-D-mannose reductase